MFVCFEANKIHQVNCCFTFFSGFHFYRVTVDLTWSANIVFPSAGISGWESVKGMQFSLLFSLPFAGQAGQGRQGRAGPGPVRQGGLGDENLSERTDSKGACDTSPGNPGVGESTVFLCPSKKDLRPQKELQTEGTHPPMQAQIKGSSGFHVPCPPSPPAWGFGV